MSYVHPYRKGRISLNNERYLPLKEYAAQKFLTPRAVLHQVYVGKLIGYFAGNRWYIYPDRIPGQGREGQ